MTRVIPSSHIKTILTGYCSGNSEGWTVTGISHSQYPLESHPLGEPSSRHANRESSRGHETRTCVSLTLFAGISDYYTLPAFAASASSSPYISTIPATSLASFATSTRYWSHNQGISAASGHTYIPGYNLDPGSRVQHERISDLTSLTQDLEPANAVNLYAAQYNQAVRNEPGANVAEAGPILGQPYSIMPGYPSPHSDMSDQRVSPCPSVYPATSMTPATVPYTATSRASSIFGSPQSAKSEEPIRKDDGVMYCNHKKCSDIPEGPPTFTRKCEWS